MYLKEASHAKYGTIGAVNGTVVIKKDAFQTVEHIVVGGMLVNKWE